MMLRTDSTPEYPITPLIYITYIDTLLINGLLIELFNCYCLYLTHYEATSEVSEAHS